MAARALARAGHGVVVLEEHAEIGYPVHCTGLLGAEAFGELGLSSQTILSIARSASFRAASGRTVLMPSMTSARRSSIAAPSTRRWLVRRGRPGGGAGRHTGHED